MARWKTRGALALILSIMVVGQSEAEPLNLVLPTDNDAIFRGEGAEFYQYIERNYKGVKSTPWEGGRYGFVRNPVETASGLMFSRLHEGIDIRPLQRDASVLDRPCARDRAGQSCIEPRGGSFNYGSM